MKNFALLLLRLTLGTLVAGHGAQKLFGWFEGPGLEGTQGMVEHMGFRPARPWAWLAALSEFGGGVLTLLGFLNPLGSMGILGAMGIATTKAHLGKPIWATKGGAELPLLNATVATAVALAGPGKWSVDHALGLRLPRWTLIPAFALTAGGVAAGVILSNQNQQAATAEQPAQPTVPAEPPTAQPEPTEQPAVLAQPGGLAAPLMTQPLDSELRDLDPNADWQPPADPTLDMPGLQ